MASIILIQGYFSLTTDLTGQDASQILVEAFQMRSEDGRTTVNLEHVICPPQVNHDVSAGHRYTRTNEYNMNMSTEVNHDVWASHRYIRTNEYNVSMSTEGNHDVWAGHRSTRTNEYNMNMSTEIKP